MRSPWLLLVALVLGGCDKTVATPAGTTLLELAPMARLTVSDWSAGAPRGPQTKVEKIYRYDPGQAGPPVRIKLSFEHGPVELVAAKPDPGKPESFLAPRAITFTVLENTAWDMKARCEDDLAVPLAVNKDGTSTYPRSVWARCSLILKRRNGDITVAADFAIHGDGQVKATTLGSGARVETE